MVALGYLLRRDDNDDDVPFGFVDEDGFLVPWWHTRTAMIVKWSIFAAVVVFIFVFVIGGYWHAKRRMRKGLPPLAYHRWLVQRRSSPAYPENNWRPSGNMPDNAYYMNAMPPPVYDPTKPPNYQGPAGGSKVDPSQNRAPVHREGEEGNPAPDYFAPPQGPPPGR